VKLISRNKSVLTRKSNLESLVTLKNFPVFFGCTDKDPKEDIFTDMKWSIDPETGVIQLTELIPLEILYQSQHVDGVGKTWEEYYNSFSEYILNQNPKNVLEIGGGQGRLAEKTLSKNPDINWTIVEPNPTYKGKYKIKLIPAFFDSNFKSDKKYDTIVFSQVLEHAYDPMSFIENIASFLEIGGRLIFAFPNLELWVKNKYTNSLNFEHTFLMSDNHIDYILSKYSFRIIHKKIYEEHSIFYTAMNTDISMIRQIRNKHFKYKKIFMDFINSYYQSVKELNKKIEFTNRPIYLFGAHIFTQYLLCLGLNKDNIISILDNSKLKQGKRLYGTNFFVESPEVLRGQYNPIVILKAGIYNEEIKKDILDNINSSTIFWE